MEQDKLFLGQGIVYIAELGSTPTGLRDTGNCTKAEYSVQTEEKSVKNHRNAAGGNYGSLTRVTAAEITLDLSDWSDENAAIAFGASVTNVVSGTATSEVATVIAKDSYIALAKIPTSITSVKDSTGVTTYVAGTDYVLAESMGLYIPAGSTIVPGDIKVTYSYGKQSVLDFLQATGKEFQLVIAGLNEYRTEEKHRISIHKCKVSPSNMSFIADDFGIIPVKFTILSDANGKYGTFERV